MENSVVVKLKNINMINKSYTFNLDFDGTVVTHSFPQIGKDIGAVPVLKKLTDAGHHLILWTMRCDNQQPLSFNNGYQIHEGNFLSQAVDWFKQNDIPLYGIQRNPTQDTWTSSPKSYCHYAIDDNAIGCPLKFDLSLSDRPFVDWVKVEEELIKLGIL